MSEDAKEHVVLVVGALGLDRLLNVPSYPEADAKIRTTAYTEQGGGNAANTASAMGLLRDAAFFRDRNIKVKLLTKVGDDTVGRQLIDELVASNVDISSPLFRKGPPGSTTSFTTIVISETEHTRTCFHTPGTCGELTVEDAQSVDMDEVFRNVVHFHSDSRFSDCSLFLAREAKTRGISISCDTEKDRKNKALDELIQLTDLLFTNSNCLIPYLGRLDSELEVKTDRKALPKQVVTCKDKNDAALVNVVTRSLTPSAFFARWYPQAGKQVVVTQGEAGALHFDTETASHMPAKESQEFSNKVDLFRSDGRKLYAGLSSNDCVACYSKHRIRQVGVLEEANVVDTTGSGDAFIGGYLMAKFANQGTTSDPTQFALSFGSWVAGQKVSGPGARSALPTGKGVDFLLGESEELVAASLSSKLCPFKFTI